MRVKKRNGQFEFVDFNKISTRIQNLVSGIDSDGNIFGESLDIDANVIAKDVCGQIIDGISTWQLDEFAAELCAYKGADKFIFDDLAKRIIISNHHKKTNKYKNFSNMMTALYNNVDVHGQPSPLLSDEFYFAVMKNKDRLDEAVNHNHIRDYESLDYFGFKTCEKGYLIMVKNSSEFIQERYQHMLMREAFNMYMDDIESALISYEQRSLSLFTHATPTLFNSGTRNPQLSSCFLTGMIDSIDGMYECIRRLSHVSKWAGGIGVWLSKIRASGSMIRGTNGNSSGLIPLSKVLNEFAQHVNQGGKRKGSVALYLEPWHADVFDFLNLKKNHGAESLRARELFYALWIPNIFMRRVERALIMKRVTGASNIKWSLMCPDECPGLPDVYSSEFDDLYTKYENEGRYRNQIDILVLWQAILDSHKENSLPYMCHKDNVNEKSNQKNIGIIRSSNLCVSGDTQILTDQGYVQIHTVNDSIQNVWNGEQFSLSRIAQTGQNQTLMEVTFNNGARLKCTSYHKFHIQGSQPGVNSIIDARNLKPGMKLIGSSFPVINGQDNLTKVPINGTLTFKLEWFKQYCRLHRLDNQLVSSADELNQVRLLLNTMGISCQVNQAQMEIQEGECRSHDRFHLTLKPEDIDYLGKLALDSSISKGHQIQVQVQSIRLLDQKENTYCLYEPIRNTAVFNGVLTGNCSEIMQYSDHNETAVCNLASINLKKMVITKTPTTPAQFDFQLLHKTAKQVTRNLNRVIDISRTPILQAKRSNFMHRAIGQGVQGLADAFILMGLPFESEEAQTLNKQIFETINHGANEASMELAHDRTQLLQQLSDDILKQLKEDSAFIDHYENHFHEQSLKENATIGVANQAINEMFQKDYEIRLTRAKQVIIKYGLNPQISEYQYMNLDPEHRDRIGAYSTFVGSPTSQGLLQNDLWGVKPSALWDFETLKQNIKKWGLRNSLLIAIMPTATTAQILGSTECIEPVTSNIYARGVLSGTFLIVNRYLQRELTALGLWNTAMKDKILMNNGSIQEIDEIPDHLKQLFKTAWDMSKKVLIKMSADRGAWIDQSQSFNLFISDPTDDLLSTVHIYAWKQGLKTGMYYLRRRTLVDPQKFSIDINEHKKNLKKDTDPQKLKVISPSSQRQISQPSTNLDQTNENPCESGACGC